jgi:hypothetical protein
MKNQIKKYLEQILRGIVTGISMFLWISICVLSIYAFDWSGVSSVSSETTLTANLWNTTMSTITWSIQTLQNSMVSLTWDQTIDWVKTFTGKIVWPTPTAVNDLTTKAYVDNTINAAWWIVFSTCSTTDKKQMFYDCDPTLAACSTVWAYCGWWKVAWTVWWSIIVSALSDDWKMPWWYSTRASAYWDMNPAPEACWEKWTFGFDDWALPNKIELNLLYINKSTIWNFYSDFYLSSEDIHSQVRCQNFSEGSQANCTKSAANNVRCIRKY